MAFLQPQREALADGLLGSALLLPGCSCISGLWTEPPRAERWHCVCGLMPLASQGSVDAGSLGPGQSPIMKGAHTHTRLKCVNCRPGPPRPTEGWHRSAQPLFPQHQGGHPGWCCPGAPLWVWTLRLPSLRWDELLCVSAVLPGHRLRLWWEGGVWKERCPGPVQHRGGRPGPGFPVKWSRCYLEDAACVGGREEDHLCSFSQSVFVKSPRWATLYGCTKTGIYIYTHSQRQKLMTELIETYVCLFSNLFIFFLDAHFFHPWSWLHKPEEKLWKPRRREGTQLATITQQSLAPKWG